MAPITKNSISKSFTKGMTPIEKNIRVVDEQGNELEATYLKRAKCLVKNGRARFIDENTICLACPPDSMEVKMDNQNIENAVYSIEYALGQLEKIRIESKTFSDKVFEMIANNRSEGPGDVGAQGNGQALATLAKEHEATTRELIDFYQKMVDELKPKSSGCKDTQERFLNFVTDCCGSTGEEPDYAMIWKMLTE